MPRRFSTRSGRLILLLSVLSPLATASAQTWEVEYDAISSTLPSAQGWTLSTSDPLPDDGLDEGNYLVAAGALTQGDTGGSSSDLANQQFYEVVPGMMDLDDDVLVLDLRLRILSSTLTTTGLSPAAGFGLALTDAAFETLHFFVSDTGVLLRNRTLPSASPFVAVDTTSGFVDYQIRLDRRQARLRIDGVEVATLERKNLTVGGSPANSLRVGDLSATDRSSSQLGSLRLSRFAPPSADVRNYEYETTLSASNSLGTKVLSAHCPPGTTALTGGASTIGADGSVGLFESRPGPESPSTSWLGRARELIDTSASWQLRVDVVCGEVSGYERRIQVEPASSDAIQSSQLGCPDGKRVFSGGAGIAGADLRQSLYATKRDTALVPEVAEFWFAGATDWGATTSAAAWSVEVETLCTDVLVYENRADVSDSFAAPVKNLTVNCSGGKVPIGGSGGLSGGSVDSSDGALRRSRPKDDALGGPPVGWDLQAHSNSALWSVNGSVQCAPIADPTVSKTGLVTRLRGEFDATDSWGWANGTLENGVGFAPGIDGQAFSFDATDDAWVSVPTFVDNASNFDVIDLYPEADFTVSVWIQTTTLPPIPGGSEVGYAAIAELYDFGGPSTATNSSAWLLWLTSDGTAYGFVRSANSNLSTTVVGTTQIADGAYHHLALVRDVSQSRLRLYVDGALEIEGTLTTLGSREALFPGNPANPDPISIGVHRLANSTALTRPFDGQIDDVLFYDRRLGLEEIQNMAGCGRPVLSRTLNLDASLFASPSDDTHGLCVFLEAGDYQLTLVDPTTDADALFTGWSAGPTAAWGTRLEISPEIDSGFGFGLAPSEPTPQDAFDNTLVKTTTLSLSAPQRVHLSFAEDVALDNRGGVSLRIVPEPGSILLLGAGSLSLFGLGRRRRPTSPHANLVA